MGWCWVFTLTLPSPIEEEGAESNLDEQDWGGSGIGTTIWARKIVGGFSARCETTQAAPPHCEE